MHTFAQGRLRTVHKNSKGYYYVKDGKKVYTRAKILKGAKPKARKGKGKSSRKSARKSSRKSSRKSRGCTRQYTKKYMSRPSPPFPANECCGQRKIGNNGAMWVSRRNSAGICQWKAY